MCLLAKIANMCLVVHVLFVCVCLLACLCLSARSFVFLLDILSTCVLTWSFVCLVGRSVNRYCVCSLVSICVCLSFVDLCVHSFVRFVVPAFDCLVRLFVFLFDWVVGCVVNCV